MKQEIKYLLDAGIIHKSMSPWASHIVVVKKKHTHLKVHHISFTCVLAVTSVTGTKKGAFALMPLPKINELFAFLKGAKYFTAFDLCSGYYHIRLDEESIPKSAFTTDLANLNF